jgi:eukaryotic-like serine/threonine-protein kinase
MKDFIDFLKDRAFHKNLIFAIIGLIVFVELVFLALRVYTRHGQALAVPDFAGQTLSEVSKTADLKNLRYRIIDSVYIQGAKPGTVVSQNPSPETKVKENRTIFLTINAINPEKVKMPNIVGISSRLAETILINCGLKIGSKIYIPGIGKDYVLRQLYHRKSKDIPVGTLILKGSSVDIALSCGEGSYAVDVPDLRLLTLSKARNALSEIYLNIGATVYDNSVESREDTLKAVVYKQSPSEGSSLNAGNEIDVWLTVDKEKAGGNKENDAN